MRFDAKNSIVAAATLTLFAFAPGTADAQQAQQDQERQECSAQVTPASVTPGQAAVQVSAQFSTALGGITAIEPAGGSGLAVAETEDLSRQSMAAEGEDPRPVQMANDGSSLEVWLNTEDAEPGTHEIVFQGADTQCSAQITVNEKEGESG